MGNRVVDDADASEDFPDQLKFRLLQLALDDIGRVADDHLALGNLGAAPDTANLLVLIVEDLVDVGIEHEGSAVDGAHSGEAFWDSAEPVDRVDKGRIAVPPVRIHVKLDLVDGFDTWPV